MRKTLNYFLIILVGCLLFLPGLGNVHLFDWDEINFAEAAREMLITGNFQYVTINFQPFYEKPPLFFWVQALSMKLWGINEFAARFPNAITGIISLLVIFHTGRQLKDEKLGWYWVLAWMASFLPHLYFKSGIIDPLFNLFMFLSAIHYFRFIEYYPEKKYQRLILGGLFGGLAVMTKGPVGILLPGLTTLIYFFLRFQYRILNFRNIFIMIISLLFIPAVYFGIDSLIHGPDFLFHFIQRNIELLNHPDAGFKGPLYYHVVILLLGVFPASFLALGMIRSHFPDQKTQRLGIFMFILLMVVVVIFSLVQTKIVHYSSLAYYPLTYLAAVFIHRKNVRVHRQIFKTLIFFGFVISFLFLLFGWALNYPLFWIDKISDVFAREALMDASSPGWKIYIPGALSLVFNVIALFVLNKNVQKKLIFFLAVNTFVIQACIYFFTSPVESFSQRPMIEFCQEFKNSGIPVVTSFKSYAPYFYGETKPEYAFTFEDKKEWIKRKKKLYLIVKSPEKNKYLNNTEYQKVKSKGGYYLFLKNRP